MQIGEFDVAAQHSILVPAETKAIISIANDQIPPLKVEITVKGVEPEGDANVKWSMANDVLTIECFGWENGGSLVEPQKIGTRSDGAEIYFFMASDKWGGVAHILFEIRTTKADPATKEVS